MRRLASLPATGPSPEQFSASGKGTHREGVVVEVTTPSGASWVGNFQPGPLELTGMWAHPNGRDVVVVAGGDLYVIDAATRTAHQTPQTHVRATLEVKSPPTLVLSDDYTLLGFGAERNWRTRRLAWDGIQRLRGSQGKILGDAWDVIGERWLPFAVDAITGAATGGCETESMRG